MSSSLATTYNTDLFMMHHCMPIFHPPSKRNSTTCGTLFNSSNKLCRETYTQQMRTEDLRYLQLLERLRHGQCNYDDYELLLMRVIGQPSIGSLHDPLWNEVNFSLMFGTILSIFVLYRPLFLYFEMKYELN